MRPGPAWLVPVKALQARPRWSGWSIPSPGGAVPAKSEPLCCAQPSARRPAAAMSRSKLGFRSRLAPEGVSVICTEGGTWPEGRFLRAARELPGGCRGFRVSLRAGTGHQPSWVRRAGLCRRQSLGSPTPGPSLSEPLEFVCLDLASRILHEIASLPIHLLPLLACQFLQLALLCPSDFPPP